MPLGQRGELQQRLHGGGRRDPWSSRERSGATQFRASFASLARSGCAAQRSNTLRRGIVRRFVLQDREQWLFVAQRGRPVGIVMHVLAVLAEAATLVKRDRRCVIVADFEGERRPAMAAPISL